MTILHRPTALTTPVRDAGLDTSTDFPNQSLFVICLLIVSSNWPTSCGFLRNASAPHASVSTSLADLVEELVELKSELRRWERTRAKGLTRGSKRSRSRLKP